MRHRFANEEMCLDKAVQVEKHRAQQLAHQKVRSNAARY